MIDDDDESVLLGFGTVLPLRVSAGATTEATVSITDDDDPQVTVSFDQDTYTVAEGNSVTVTVTLSADPERTVNIPLRHTSEDGAESPADYSGVPANLTFNSGETEQTFTFTATNDADDDDDESVRIRFGGLPIGVSPGATDQTTISITDNDHPQVTVSFSPTTYTVAESGPTDGDGDGEAERRSGAHGDHSDHAYAPGRGRIPADYSGVPANLRFNSGDTRADVHVHGNE